MNSRPSRKKPARAIPLAAILLVAGGVTGSLLVVAASLWFCWRQWQNAFPPSGRQSERRAPAVQPPMLWLPPPNPGDVRVNDGQPAQQPPPARDEEPESLPAAPDASEFSSPPVPPVRLRPVQLAYQHQIGSRPLLLQSWQSSKKSAVAGRESAEQCATQIRFLETTEAIDAQGLAGIRLSYRDYARQAWVDGQELPRLPWLPVIRQTLQDLTVNLRVDSQGNLVDFQTASRSVPPSGSVLQEEIERWLRILTVPLPNKLVSPGDTWRAEQACPIRRADNGTERNNGEMVYSYIGVRGPSGREEAVLGMQGRPRNQVGSETLALWQAEGRAVVAVEFGQVAAMDLRIYFASDTKALQPSAPADGSLTLRLRRALSQEEGRGFEPVR
jgi:hypothetical protein